MGKIILFKFKNHDISVTIEAFFNNDELVIEGYDVGKTVLEAWGDSDYEYVTTVSKEEVEKLYQIFSVKEGDKEGLLSAIASKFCTNSCFSDFNSFLNDNNIKSGGFSWS